MTIDDFIILAEKALSGDASSQFKLGRCFTLGDVVNIDYSQAVKWYTQAAEQGNSDAQNSLGVCYKIGRGVEIDYDKAVYWFTQAVELENHKAQYNLGLCYFWKSRASLTPEGKATLTP